MYLDASTFFFIFTKLIFKQFPLHNKPTKKEPEKQKKKVKLKWHSKNVSRKLHSGLF